MKRISKVLSTYLLKLFTAQPASQQGSAKSTIVVVGNKADGKSTLLKSLCEIDNEIANKAKSSAGYPSPDEISLEATGLIIEKTGEAGSGVKIVDVPGELVQNYVRLRNHYFQKEAVQAVLDGQVDQNNLEHLEAMAYIDGTKTPPPQTGFAAGFPTGGAQGFVQLTWTQQLRDARDARVRQRRIEQLQKLNNFVKVADCVLVVLQPKTVASAADRFSLLNNVREAISRTSLDKPRMVGVVLTKYDQRGVFTDHTRVYSDTASIGSNLFQPPKEEPWLAPASLNGFFHRQSRRHAMLQGYRIAALPEQPGYPQQWGVAELWSDIKLHIDRNQNSKLVQKVRIGVFGLACLVFVVLLFLLVLERQMLDDYRTAFSNGEPNRNMTVEGFDELQPEVQEAFAAAYAHEKFKNLSNKLTNKKELAVIPWTTESAEAESESTTPAPLFDELHLKRLPYELKRDIEASRERYDTVTDSINLVKEVSKTGTPSWDALKRSIEALQDPLLLIPESTPAESRRASSTQNWDAVLATLEARSQSGKPGNPEVPRPIAPVERQLVHALRSAVASHFDDAVKGERDGLSENSPDASRWDSVWCPIWIDNLRDLPSPEITAFRNTSWFFSRYNPYFAPKTGTVNGEPLGFRALTVASPFPTEMFFAVDKLFTKSTEYEGWRMRLADEIGAVWRYEVDFFHRTVRVVGESPLLFSEDEASSLIPIDVVLHSIVVDQEEGQAKPREFTIRYHYVDTPCSLYLLRRFLGTPAD